MPDSKNRRDFLKSIGLMGLGLSTLNAATAVAGVTEGKSPNVVLIFSELRRELDAPELPVCLVQINSQGGPHFPYVETVRAQQQQLGETLAHTHVVSTDGFKLVDAAHFDSKSQLRRL